MDTWKFFDITHRRHLLCNPTSTESLDEVIELLDLPPTPSILDIASGKGEFLTRVTERYGSPGGEGVRAVAIDISPFCVSDLRTKVADRVPAASIEILEMDAARYEPAPASFDLAVCLGASWVYGGFRGELQALKAAVRPGGLILSGEVFWKHEPQEEYLAAEGMQRDDFGTHAGNVEAGVATGLVPLFSLVSTEREWDRYETLQWASTARYAAEHPDDADLPELLSRVEASRQAYLRWGRDTLGWAIYLFMRGA